MFTDAVTLYTIAWNTSTRLDVFLGRAREGKDLHAAKEFCSYLEFSGILNLLAAFGGDEQPAGLKFDPAHIRWKLDQVLNEVHSQFRHESKVVNLQLSQLETLNHKLDLIAAHVAKFSQSMPPDRDGACDHPALTVVSHMVETRAGRVE